MKETFYIGSIPFEVEYTRERGVYSEGHGWELDHFEIKDIWFKGIKFSDLLDIPGVEDELTKQIIKSNE